MAWNLRSVGFFVALAGLVGCANPSNSTSGTISANDLKNDGQIIGGTDATGEEDFTKSIVSLYNVADESLCTASIITDSILVTAAHCVDGKPSDLRVVFGVSLEDTNIIIKPVEAFQVSPLWPVRQNQEFNSGDIAVVRFAGGLPAGYKPVPMLTDAAVLKDGQPVLLAGYGISDGVESTGAGRLRYVETTIQNAKFSKTEVLVDQTKGKGACHGDSGGPAYIEMNGKRLLWGVTSRGVNDPNNDCSVSAAYTSIAYYTAWISMTSLKLEQQAKSRQPQRKVLAAGF